MYTRKQLERLKRQADAAYAKIASAIAHDPDLDRAYGSELGSCISRAQGSLLDLSAECDTLLEKLA